MFDNIGEKIKKITKFFFWIATLACIILAFVSFAAADKYSTNDIEFSSHYVIGIALLIGGPLLAWFSSLLIYAFGELVDNSTILARMFPKVLLKEIKKIHTEGSANPDVDEFAAVSGANRAAVDYSCSSIEVLNGTMTGTCVMCGTPQTMLYNCRIGNTAGTRELYICNHCASKYLDNSSAAK